MENLRGAAIMVLSMLGFAIEDMFIKLLAGAISPGQIVMMLGIGGGVIFGAMVRAQGDPLWSSDMLSRPVLTRAAGEVFGTMGFITAIALIPLSTASAILQATPLVVTAGAALFLGEPVGWRRWTACTVGFFGVLLIIRPGLDGFTLLSLLAVQGVIGLAIRDLATRSTTARLSTMQLSFLGFVVLIPAGPLLVWLTDSSYVWPTSLAWIYLASALGIGVFAYYGIVLAVRIGQLSYVTPFRYSRMLFALVIGILVFAERPDTLTLAGAVIIIASGIYTIWRERKQAIQT